MFHVKHLCPVQGEMPLPQAVGNRMNDRQPSEAAQDQGNHDILHSVNATLETPHVGAPLSVALVGSVVVHIPEGMAPRSVL